MSNKNIVFATPSLDHRVTLDYLRSWTSTSWLLSANGILHGRIDRGGDCFVAKVRNKLVQQFLDGEGTDLFFLDDDIGWPAKAVLDFVNRPEDIIAGVYPKKSDQVDWPVALEANAVFGDLISSQGLYLAGFAPGGFMRIKRHVLEAMVKDAPRFQDIELHGETATYPLLFTSGLDADGWWCGEDVAFCRLAKAHGFDVWIDPDIHFIHRGSKNWSGSLADHLPHFRERALAAIQGAA